MRSFGSVALGCLFYNELVEKVNVEGTFTRYVMATDRLEFGTDAVWGNCTNLDRECRAIRASIDLSKVMPSSFQSCQMSIS